MLTIKYSKLFPSSMVSHIDMLRVMNRIIRRSGLDTEYSKGFNPHMLLFFSPPLSLGAESECEYVTVAAEKGDLTPEALNAFCPQGIVCGEFFVTEKSPNLAARIEWAEYSIKADGIGKTDLSGIIDAEGYEITYLEKGEPVTKNVRPLIRSLERVNDDEIQAVIACGNKNLKADRLANGILRNGGIEPHGLSILKTQAFTADMPVDEYLRQEENRFLGK